MTKRKTPDEPDKQDADILAFPSGESQPQDQPAEAKKTKSGKPYRRHSSKAQAALEHKQAFELLLQGASFEHIAEIQGYADKSGVWRAVTKYMKGLPVPNANQWRQLHVARLEYALSRLAPAIRRGDPFAMKSMVDILNREARMLGIDAPAKTDVRADVRAAVTTDPAEVVKRVEALQAIIIDITGAAESNGHRSDDSFPSAEHSLLPAGSDEEPQAGAVPPDVQP